MIIINVSFSSFASSILNEGMCACARACMCMCIIMLKAYLIVICSNMQSSRGLYYRVMSIS